MKWRTIYRARQNGAIGLPYSVTVDVEADNILSAADKAWEKIHETHEVFMTLSGPREIPEVSDAPANAAE